MCVCVCELRYLEAVTEGFCVSPPSTRVKQGGEEIVLNPPSEGRGG